LELDIEDFIAQNTFSHNLLIAGRRGTYGMMMTLLMFCAKLPTIA